MAMPSHIKSVACIAGFGISTAICGTFVFAQTQPAIEPDHAPAGYTLVFSDEFNVGTMPDPAKWDYATERNAEGWFNQEKQYYAKARPENSRIENGKLIIEARAETLDRATYADWSGQKYTSARLLTRGKASWAYGFFEIRAKLPCGVGTWPAIWTLPEDPKVKWPNGGELDIMEHVGFAPGEINQTVHTKAFNFGNGTQKTTKFAVPAACDAMHRYQMLWTEDFVLMGVDDKPKFMFRRVENDRARWPFDQPHHLLLNIAVGGSWGGQKGIRPEAFPARMEVDYVRVYQRVPTAKTP
jgi:beta-glucanase (GH16 family)